MTTGRLARWLGELRPTLVALLPLAAGAGAVALFRASEEGIRLCGLALQLLGIGAVAWGIVATRRQFGLPSLLSRAWGWLRRFPLVRRGAHLRPEGITVSSSAIGGRLTEVFTALPEAPTAQRLARIEHGMEILQRRLDQAESQLDAGISMFDGKLRAEAHARAQDVAGLHQAIESASTGGLYISAIGTLWLLAGAVLGTASPEISAWFN